MAPKWSSLKPEGMHRIMIYMTVYIKMHICQKMS
jgi:hypothetical protein